MPDNPSSQISEVRISEVPLYCTNFHVFSLSAYSPREFILIRFKGPLILLGIIITDHYSWLEYSVKKDATFCFPCRFFGSGSIGRGRPEKAFTRNGFRDWKHATGNKGVLHSNNSYSHTQSVVAWEQFKAMSSSGSVAEQLGSNSGHIRCTTYLL